MTRYFRLSGAGNDFLAFAEPEPPPTPEAVRRWCRRGLSLGADGVVHLSRGGNRVELVHRNADGGLSELCVNGTRCAARLAFHLGWAERELTLATPAGEIRAVDRGPDGIELTLPPPAPARPLTLAIPGARREGFFLRVGVPHFVLPWNADLDAAPLAVEGPTLRRHPELGAEGANVHFVRFEPPHHLAIRSWERGVEGETLACGSGVLAAVAVGIAFFDLASPVEALTRGGCRLRVEARAGNGAGAGTIESWTLLGEARLLAEGRLLGDAGAAC